MGATAWAYRARAMGLAGKAPQVAKKDKALPNIGL